MNTKNLSHIHAEILMLLIILARSTSYVMSKIALGELDALNLLGIRFLLAFAMLSPLFWRDLVKISRVTFFRGMLLGGVATLVMAAEVTGLKTANASTAAFLENTAIIFVPAFEAVIRRKFPDRHIIISVVIAMSGIALLTLRGGALKPSRGEILCLVAAVLYACAIIITDRLSHTDKPLIIGTLQVGFMGLFSMILASFTEHVIIPQEPRSLFAIIYLSVVCTFFGFTLQPLAQSKITSERASLFCAIGPVGGALTGWILLGENLSMSGICGMILILCAVILPYLRR